MFAIAGTVLATVEALFASIRRNLDTRGAFKPVMDRGVNRLTDDQADMERNIRRKAVGNVRTGAILAKECEHI